MNLMVEKLLLFLAYSTEFTVDTLHDALDTVAFRATSDCSLLVINSL